MRDFRINPNETEREREIRVCQSPAYEVNTMIDKDEVIRLWHIARVAGHNSRFDRLQYVKREYLKTHPEWLAKPTTLWIEICDATLVF